MSELLDIPQDPEGVQARPVWVTTGVVVLAILASIAVALLLMRCGAAPIHARSGAMLEDEPPVEVNQIEAHVFGYATAAELDQLEARRRLGSWGWSDRARRRVHVPADVAIERYLEERARAAGGAP